MGPGDGEPVTSAEDTRRASRAHRLFARLIRMENVQLRGWMEEMPDRERHVLVRRYGLDVREPVLVCSAARSGPNSEDNPDLRCSDTVLDVRQIAYRAPLLGEDVTYEPIEGAVHDLALSARPARDTYLAVVLGWLDARSREWRTPAGTASMERTTT